MRVRCKFNHVDSIAEIEGRNRLAGSEFMLSLPDWIEDAGFYEKLLDGDEQRSRQCSQLPAWEVKCTVTETNIFSIKFLSKALDWTASECRIAELERVIGHQRRQKSAPSHG